MNSFIRDTPARAEVINTMANLKPTWDEKTKELRLGNVLIKRFRWPAPNQIRILEAYHEQGWPERIDDPLPQSKTRAKTKLHDTIKCLNKNHEQNPGNLKELRPLHLIKFRGDGTGQGVLLEILPAGLEVIAGLNQSTPPDLGIAKQEPPAPTPLNPPKSKPPTESRFKSSDETGF